MYMQSTEDASASVEYWTLVMVLLQSLPTVKFDRERRIRSSILRPTPCF